MMRPLAMIAAVGRNGAIGLGNRLPWRLRGDMQHFRALTMGKPVILGRKTLQSIGRPLPGRILVVVSRGQGFVPPEGVTYAGDVEAALQTAEALATAAGAAEIMVAGGAMIYDALMPRARRLYVTEVDLAPEADAFFPGIDPLLWRQISREPGQKTSADEAGFVHVTYERL